MFVLQEAEAKFTEAIEYHPKVGQYYISRSRARHMLEVCTAFEFQYSNVTGSIRL